MSGVLIHDGRRIGHRKWCVDAISTGSADGVVLNPFATPRVAESRHPSASDMVQAVRGVRGEVVFDAMTHALFLPATNKRDFYDAWELWGPAGPGLEGQSQQLAHIERVFDRQSQIGAPRLAPTLQLKSPQSPDAYLVRDMARVARGLDADCWQSLVGTRSFWAAGAQLDAYVGSLAALRAPVWMVTVANEMVVDHVPDLMATEAFAGLCRTVHSLSLRSRVILAYGDFAALPAVAAGADTVGSGWDRGQRTFDPLAFRVDSDPGIRIPASYVTQGGLNAVLRRDTAEAIERWDSARARRIRGGPMPPSDQAQRMHHLHQLRSAVLQIDAAGSARRARVDALRDRYRTASADFDALIAGLPRIVREADKAAWVSNPAAALESYAGSEGL
ncbi:hypothetical protein IU443_18620 [Nocardia farcinica]|uniref:hypothetical protein n=1 Tax=Nocardia farcinica TaxID=37329 RepID=UPI001893A8B3|nr:hypothetical protein [Nocardia farcinica]MBF6264323.1 hypothetical protein [Nocardia farcinica]MBF6282527.1 hypothetical protein [Nocardia farcinica]MBF6307647.1 hypothetical protein [Nocardia farcinica]MBF6391962.1 hypothetical protein [Nocardia farcinica]MBF6489898.1 hypothetical protein [Nocardia farcinica]